MATLKICGETILMPQEDNAYSLSADAQLMEKHWSIKPGDVCVDAGFGPGSWTLVALAKGGITYSFDPKLLAMSILTELIHLNSYGRAAIIPTGLWKNSGTELFGVNSFKDQDSIKPMPVVSLDDFFMDRNIGRLDYLNMDVEGSELEVLIGARRVLHAFAPKLIIEVHRGVSWDALKAELLAVADYRISTFGGTHLIAESARKVYTEKVK